LSGIGGWVAVALAASSLGSATVEPSASTESAQGYGQPSAWDTYKVRLAMLAAQQGVSQATIRANVPGLTINRSAIEMERTEPVARSVGGLVSQISPYLRSHVTPSLIRRGQANYSDHYQSLRSLEARYGVDAAVLMAIWGHETSYGQVTGNTDLLNALASLG
jgi:membrane-bound lytic murein transglycosylase B